MRNSMQGQGLIETLIVLLFITISIGALMSFQHYLSYSTDVTRAQMDANILAMKQSETLRDFQVLTPTSGYTDYSSIDNGSSSQTVGNTTFTINWTVTTNVTPPYKTITVTVSWNDRYGTAQSVTLVSYVAGIDPGLSGKFM